jgi:hypothetical protein
MAEGKQSVDWDAIEAAYRAGQLSNRAIGKQFGVSDTAIRQKARVQGWAKDLTSAVQKAVRSELVRTTVRTLNVSEREIIEAAAATGAQVVRTHRTDIRNAASLVGTLMEQLSEAIHSRYEIAADIEQETEGDKDNQRRARMMRAISLQSHAAVMRDLSTAAKNLIGLERQAFNLDEIPAGDNYDDMLVAVIEKGHS